ncbi:hypothetical protein MTR67_018509, partial [Solanum verrucosum]
MEDMNTRANWRRAEEEIDDGGVPPQGMEGDQAPLGGKENVVLVVPSDITNGEIREAFLSMACAMTTQANRDVRPRVNAIESTVASRLRDFIRMNPSTFFGSMINEDSQNFIVEVFWIVDAMGVTPREKVELASYQLKDIAQVWFEQWRDERPIGADPIDWGVFKTTFLDRFFPLELREQNLVVVTRKEWCFGVAWIASLFQVFGISSRFEDYVYKFLSHCNRHLSFISFVKGRVP